MKLELGRKYLTRNGSVLTYFRFMGDTYYPCIMLDSRKVMHKYTLEGRYVHGLDGHRLDIIGEC